MAEQRPYRIPGSSAEARLGRVKLIAVVSMAAAFAAVNEMTTQHAAHVLHHAPWLGEPLFRAPGIGAVYAPWAWIAWWARWHDAPALAPLWTPERDDATWAISVSDSTPLGPVARARSSIRCAKSGSEMKKSKTPRTSQTCSSIRPATRRRPLGPDRP